ncbi:MAG: peptidylprolyl isomerase [Bacteroidales bacterium]|nr:peptidylprolyl isomerase [Bacteroidales bacterium]
MIISKDKVVAITYELEVEGAIVDHATKERPLEYIHGNHNLLEKFEQNLEGKTVGDLFEFTLTPAEGYGESDPERIIDLPKDMFKGQDGKYLDEFLRVGARVPLVNAAGQMIPGVVVEVGQATVKMDLNSPMAGKTLHFTGSVVSIREATEKELKEGLRGEYVQSNCCGNCGGCHGESGCHKEGEGCGEGKGHGECCGKGEGKGHCHNKK